MGARSFCICHGLAEASVMFSCLEAGGFHPVFENYHHANINAFIIIALGGIRISLPAEELAAARDYVAFCQSQALTDYAPLPLRRFGKWKTGTLFALCFAPDFRFFLPLFFLPAEALMVLWAISFIWGGFDLTEMTSYLFIIPLMLLHAKYIALPKIRKARHDPARPL